MQRFRKPTFYSQHAFILVLLFIISKQAFMFCDSVIAGQYLGVLHISRVLPYYAALRA